MVEPSIKLGNRTITEDSKPYIIAEVGVNHEGSMDLAKKLIDLAKEGGADAVKFQTYKAGKIASKNSPSYWDTSKESTKSQFELFSKYDSFDAKDYEELFLHCKQQEIEFISTPFDHDAVDFLDDCLNFYKISSSDITNIPLLKYIATKNKPIILSTGASFLNEIDFAIKTIESYSNEKICLLHCILNYPTLDNDANLRMISKLKKNFPDKIIGYSDHTMPEKRMKVLCSSYLLGALVIEKHFTHDKNLPGNDHYHAMDINDLKNFKKELNQIYDFLGFATQKEPISTESISRQNARRSLVLKNNLKKGDIIKEDDLICKRPATGISPIDIKKIIGKRINKNLQEDEILKWDIFD